MPDTTKPEQPRRVPRQHGSAHPQRPNPLALAKLLEEWMHGDEAEQRETFDLLRRGLDEDRPEGYKLFP